MNQPPIAIILTMPKAFFADRQMSYEDFEKEFEECLNDPQGYWNFVKHTLPLYDVPYVYLVYDGKVQYKTNCVGYERNKTKSFVDAPDKKVRRFENKNWILLSGPAIKATIDIPMQGFQGFKYLFRELF